jgi:ubiquinone/menaquinone biosynthesis C-methylase UbiE
MGVHGPDARVNTRVARYMRPGFARRYHAYRPRPPRALVDVVRQIAAQERPWLVVDLGAGTGLSTILWAGHAVRVIGIEPLEEMRRVAMSASCAPGVEYQPAVAHDTGMPDGAADVVTCSQSFHHMEPDATLAEIERILRPGGVFAAYDYDVPPVVRPDVEQAFFALEERIGELGRRHGLGADASRGEKDAHARRMRESGFRHVREVLLHQAEPCTADRWIGFALTVRPMSVVLPLELPEAERAVDAFRRATRDALGDGTTSWHVSFRARIGVK